MRFLAWLTARRVRSSWRLMLASAFGVLLAVTVMSVSVIHSNTLAKAGLHFSLAPAAARGNLNLIVTVGNRPLGLPDYARLRRTVDEKTQEYLSETAEGVHRLGLTQDLPLAAGPDHATTVPGAFAYFFFQEGFQDHTRLVSGRWPQAAPEGSSDGARPLEVTVGTDVVRRTGWSEGTLLSLVPFITLPTERVLLMVVGVVEIVNASDPFWFGIEPRLDLEEHDPGILAPLYVQEADFFNVLGKRYPMLLGDYWWFVSLNSNDLTPASAAQARESLDGLDSDMQRGFPRSAASSALGTQISSYERDLAVARVPLFMFTSLVVGVVLYYLVLLSWMLARSRGSEAAMLRSRGASRFHVGALLGLGEGLVVVVPAVIVGPFLGLGIARVLPVGGSGLEHVGASLSPAVFIFAGLAGLACIAVFLVSGLGVAGQNIIQFLRERTRPQGSATLYRYAIDLLVLIVVGLVWWQIRGRGGFLTRNLLGEGLEVDLTLLLGPALGLLAVGMIMLRALPYVLRLLAWVAGSVSGVWLVHGLNRMARDPLPYGALAVLLMLATALGVFGATFGPTLTGGQSDRVRYDIGGELVIAPTGDPSAQGMKHGRQALEGVAGVQIIADVNHGDLLAIGTTSGGINATLLAVDPAQFPKVAWFRDDFSNKSLDELLLPLDLPAYESPGVDLPEGTTRVGVWARPEFPSPGFTLWARYRDSAGLYEQVALGELNFANWTLLEAALPERVHLKPPYALTAFYVSGPLRSFVGRGSLALDDAIAVVDGERRVVEEFELIRQWVPIPSSGAAQDTMRIANEAARTGNSGALFEWTFPLGGPPRGFFLSPVPLPLIAIGGPSFFPGQIIIGRIGVQPVTVQIREIVHYFPTLDPGDGPFLVVNLETINLLQRSLPQPRLVVPSAHWIGLEQGADSGQIQASIEDVLPPGQTTIRNREAAVQRVKSDPLAGGPWRGLAFLALGALLGVAILGYVLYAALAFQYSRLELGLLRALGFTRGQVALVLGLGGLIVALVGLAVGIATGAWMGQWILGYLDITSGGRTVAPPMLLAQDPQILGLAYGGVALAAILATLLALTLANRLHLPEVLRVEE